MNKREKNIAEIEYQWCEQMTVLVSNNEIENADALFSEFVVDGIDPNDAEWIFIQAKEDVC